VRGQIEPGLVDIYDIQPTEQVYSYNPQTNLGQMCWKYRNYAINDPQKSKETRTVFGSVR